jgi:predicted DNA-binding transcriptional regulator AlpA
MISEVTPLLNELLIEMGFIIVSTRLADKGFGKLIQDGLFPKPLKLGASLHWFKNNVVQWLSQPFAHSQNKGV